MAGVTGLEEVIKNLNKTIAEIEGDISKGVHAAALFVQGESLENTPVEFGVLANSSFVDAQWFDDSFWARVGYTAEYAPYVHEMPASYNFTKPGTGPKFLQRAVSNNHVKILKIIFERAKL